MDVNKKRKTDQFVEEPVKKKKTEQKDEAKTPHSAENTQEELEDKKEETSNADKLKALKEKNGRDSETLSKLHLGITKQKMQIDKLKTQWRNRQRRDKEMSKCFEEVHEHQSMLYEQLCDVNVQLNKAQKWSKVLKRTFGKALEDKKLFSERVNQLQNKLETLNKSKFITKQQIQKNEETHKVSVETWTRKMQQEGEEICELQKMIQSKKQALDNLTEAEQNLRKKLNEAIEQEKVFLEKGKVCQALIEKIQQFKLDHEAKLLERKKLETSLESLRLRKKDIENQVSNFTDEADQKNWALKNKDEEELEKRISDLQQKIENEEQEQTMIRKKISEDEAEIEKTQTIVSMTLRTQSDNNESIVTLKETRRSVTEQIESESMRFNKKEKDNRSHAEEIRLLKEQLENEERKKDDIDLETNSQNETEASKDAKIAQLTDESKVLELEFAEAEKENKTVAAEVKKSYCDKKQQTQLKKEATALKKKAAKNEAKTEELKTMIEILTTDKKFGLKNQSELEQKLKLTDKEIEKLKESIKNEKKEKEAIEQELKKCEAELQRSLDVNAFDFFKEPLVDPTDEVENLLNFDFNLKSISSPILPKKKSNEEKDKVFSLIDNTIETLKNTNLNVDRSSSLKSKPLFNSSQNSGSQENVDRSLSSNPKSLFSSQSAKSQSPKVPAAKTPTPKPSTTKSTPKSSTPKSLAQKSLKLKSPLPKSPASGSKPPAENKEPKSILAKKSKFLKAADKTVTFLSPVVSKSKKQSFF